MTDDNICARIKELQTFIAAGVIALEISNRNARVQALQDRWDRMRKLIHERGIEMANVKGGGSTGLLCRDYKGKDATAEVYKVDTALLAELRAHERQAAEELGQWITKSESSALNLSEIIERLNAGRRRAREAWEKRQALAAGTQTEA
jgi:hypothetical protein